MITLYSATLEGMEAKPVEVEATCTKGLPSFGIVGLGGTAIQESKERIKAALIENGFQFPPLRITVNLSPSDQPKQGSHFDLAIALAIAMQKEPMDTGNLYIFGELGLDGKVKATRTLFALLLSLKNQASIQKAMVPKEALSMLAFIPDIEWIGIESLSEAIAYLQGDYTASSLPPSTMQGTPLTIKGKTYYYLADYPLDFSEVKGQTIAKRAALIAAAGFHNLLMEGSPGCGKSMIAKRVRYILPPMSPEEILQATHYALLGDEEATFAPLRPFRAPHHSSSKPSIFGGGTHSAKIGEAALANRGILFFDELPHFQKSVLEALREPLQDYRIRISRVHSKVEYATCFLFIAAQNPCPCGNLLSPNHSCRCSEHEISRYKSRLSEPLLDRIDLYVQMQTPSPTDRAEIDSQQMHQQVMNAFCAQKKRDQPTFNGKLGEADIERYCQLDSSAQALLQKAISRYSLSHRAVANAKKVARTIADLQGAETITSAHLLEALGFRRRA